ncbi:hypothetical protein QUF75_14565 [Desulfococcaceae bacterium HSG7]|nr:hypothetical protein [Desulfococcaceae bacterium HSG7]
MDLPFDLREVVCIDIKNDKAIGEIFHLLTVYLNEFKKRQYPYDFIIPFPGMMDKYEKCASYLGVKTSGIKELTHEFINAISKGTHYTATKYKGSELIKRIFFSGPLERQLTKNKTYLKSIDIAFQELYNEIIMIFNEAQNNKSNTRSIELNGFYNPENSHKQKAESLINEAIKLIEDDDTLSPNAKESIISYLKKAIAEFDKPKSNWTIIFGRLKEAILILGALGSLTGGISGTVALTEAKGKLEEATNVIEKTSININYHNVNQIFDIENNMLLIHSQPQLLIEEKKNNDKTIVNANSTQLEEQLTPENECENIEIEHNKANSDDAKNRAAD